MSLSVIPYKGKFLLWSKVGSLFLQVQFFANLKIHKMLIPEIYLFKHIHAFSDYIGFNFAENLPTVNIGKLELPRWFAPLQ